MTTDELIEILVSCGVIQHGRPHKGKITLRRGPKVLDAYILIRGMLFQDNPEALAEVDLYVAATYPDPVKEST